MLPNHGAAHEDFAWAIRSEPGIVGSFEKTLGTEDIIVPFDAINYGFDNCEHLPANKPWPHQDPRP